MRYHNTPPTQYPRVKSLAKNGLPIVTVIFQDHGRWVQWPNGGQYGTVQLESALSEVRFIRKN